MSLISLAIVGKENEPLYLKQFTPQEEDPLFGAENVTCSLDYQFMMHASLDRFEEVAIEQRWRKNATGTESMWLGPLCTMEGFRLYGYLTSTNTKFIVMTDSSAEKREHDLKEFFATLHSLFVQYTMNPFSKLKEKISSPRFDEGVKSGVAHYNQSLPSNTPSP